MLLAALVVVALALPACFGGGPSLTASGAGKPEIVVDFPRLVPAGSTHSARVEVTNPGPGDMDSLFIAFSLVGVGGSAEPPQELVRVGSDGKSPSLVSIRPRPVATAPDGVVLRFRGLKVGEVTTVRFDIRVPAGPGIAANSLTAYAGEEPSRAAGVRLETRVQG